MNHSEIMKFYNLSFFNSSDLSFESKKAFFCSFWLKFCPLDPNPGSQNLADPTAPDPKHCIFHMRNMPYIMHDTFPRH